MKIVHEWLSELVPSIPDDVETVAREISLRGFEVASVEDGVIDFEITANRPDCLNHIGIAREAAVIWSHDGPLSATPRRMAPSWRPRPATGDDRRAGPVPALCRPDFDITVGPSPAWLAARLENSRRPLRSTTSSTSPTT